MVHAPGPRAVVSTRTVVVSERVLGLEEEPTDRWVRYTCEQRNSDRDENQKNRNVFFKKAFFF